jgi:hypothetical protein
MSGIEGIVAQALFLNCRKQAISLIDPFGLLPELRQRFKVNEHPLRRFDDTSQRVKPLRFVLGCGTAEAVPLPNLAAN